MTDQDNNMTDQDGEPILIEEIREQPYLSPEEFVAEKAAILAALERFLVVPRGAIVGTEYAYSPAPGHVLSPDDRDAVIWMARHRGGMVVERPILAWTPSPLPEDTEQDKANT